MKLSRKRIQKLLDLQLEINLVSEFLYLTIDLNDKGMFIAFYEEYALLLAKYRKLAHVNYIDCDIEFYADSIGLMRD